MLYEDLNGIFRDKLKNAALLMANSNEEQPLCDLIEQVYSVAFQDGYNSSIQTLQDNAVCSNSVQEITKRIKDMPLLDNNGNALSEEDMRVGKFKQDVLERTSFECLPTTLLYDMYLGWHENKYKDKDDGIDPYGRNLFFDSIRRQIDPKSDGWCLIDGVDQERVNGRMHYNIEPLLLEYHCYEWMKNPTSTDPIDLMTLKKIPVFARGLFKLDSMSQKIKEKHSSKR